MAELSEHQRKRAIGEVRFANMNLCKNFLKKLLLKDPTTVTQNRSYISTIKYKKNYELHSRGEHRFCLYLKSKLKNQL